MNRHHLPLLIFYYYRHCSNRRSCVYRCDSREVWGPDWGVKWKNFLGSLTLAVTSCTNQLLFTLLYPHKNAANTQ